MHSRFRHHLHHIDTDDLEIIYTRATHKAGTLGIIQQPFELANHCVIAPLSGRRSIRGGCQREWN